MPTRTAHARWEGTIKDGARARSTSEAETRWPHRIVDLITHRHRYTDFDAAFQHHGADEIKVVLEWAA
jgi:hypothetical protein